MMLARVLRIVDLPESGAPRLCGAEALTAPPPGVVRWIDIEGPTPELLECIRTPFGLHPLAIEDCLTFGQRPKLEEYPGHLFVVIHELVLKSKSIESIELHSFIGSAFLITVHAEPCLGIEQVHRRVANDSDPNTHGVGFLYYLVANAVATANVAVLDELGESIEELEEQLLNSRDLSLPASIFELKHAVASARRALSPQRDLFASLARFEARFIGPGAALYLRDVHDRLVRGSESLEISRELLSNLLDAHFSLVSQRTNEIMKRLTALSAIFLPLTFMTGFFGQNFETLPFDSAWLFWAAIMGCLVVPAGMLVWFRSRRWI